MIVYRTKQGDVLDAIVHKYYEGQPGALEQVLDANEGLVKYGAILPAGLEVVLPELPAPPAQVSVTLW